MCGPPGDPKRPVQRVAVCGGAGDSALDAAVAAGVDAYVTADLRHHPAAEHLLAHRGPAPALVDVAHWASEWPWCGQAAASCARRTAVASRSASRTPHRPVDGSASREDSGPVTA